MMTKKLKLDENHEKCQKLKHRKNKIAKLGEMECGRLGRYKNRHEASKNALSSWDRGLSISGLKRFVGDRSMTKKQTIIWVPESLPATFCC